MNKKEDFIKNYYNGFQKLTGVSLEDFEKYYNESIYGGYPEEPGGSVWESEGKSIYTLIRILKPKSILEIGNYKGKSTNHILQAIDMNGFGDVVLVDIQENLEYDKLHSKNFNRIIDDSLNYLNNPFEFELIIQDGDHTQQHVKKEIGLILQNNKLGEYYIWGHDYWQRSVVNQCGVWLAWDEMKHNFSQFESFKDSVSDCGCLITKK